MKRLSFSITIDASKEKVWKSMLEPKTYEQWTAAFAPGSRFEGSWETGARIKFLEAQGNGMISEIVEIRPFEFVSIRHIGVINNGIEDYSSEGEESWAGAMETYTLHDLGGKTELKVEQDTVESYEDFMLEAWAKALQILKEISESKVTQ